MVRSLIGVAVFCGSLTAFAGEPREAEAVALVESANGTCSAVSVLRSLDEAEASPKARAVFQRAIADRVDAALLPVEALIVQAGIADDFDPVAFELLRKALIVSRCYNSERVDRDLSFLRRTLELRAGGI